MPLCCGAEVLTHKVGPDGVRAAHVVQMRYSATFYPKPDGVLTQKVRRTRTKSPPAGVPTGCRPANCVGGSTANFVCVRRTVFKPAKRAWERGLTARLYLAS